jgi:CBS domain-containing protein
MCRASPPTSPTVEDPNEHRNGSPTKYSPGAPSTSPGSGRDSCRPRTPAGQSSRSRGGTGRHAPLVRDVMSPDPAVVHPEDEVGPLLELFERRDFYAVLVADAAGNLVGIVTKLSLLRLFRRAASSATPDTAAWAGVPVSEVMDTRTVWVEPADPLDALVRQMMRHRVLSVPVVERAPTDGMVSRGDLLRGFAKV